MNPRRWTVALAGAVVFYLLDAFAYENGVSDGARENEWRTL